MLAHVALPSCQIEGDYWAGERGLLSTAQVQCGKNGGFDVSFWLYLFIYCYCVIYLYIYIGIVLFIYCTFWHIRYSIFKGTVISFRLLIMARITVVAVFLSFIELSYYLFLISWQCASGLRSFLPISLMNVSAKSYLYIRSFFKSWWQRIVSCFNVDDYYLFYCFHFF